MNGVNDGGVRTIRETRKVSPSSSELARLARDYNDDATSPNDESKNGDMANEDKIEPSENTRPLSATRGVKSAPIPPRDVGAARDGLGEETESNSANLTAAAHATPLDALPLSPLLPPNAASAAPIPVTISDILTNGNDIVPLCTQGVGDSVPKSGESTDTPTGAATSGGPEPMDMSPSVPHEPDGHSQSTGTTVPSSASSSNGVGEGIGEGTLAALRQGMQGIAQIQSQLSSIFSWIKNAEVARQASVSSVHAARNEAASAATALTSTLANTLLATQDQALSPTGDFIEKVVAAVTEELLSQLDERFAPLNNRTANILRRIIDNHIGGSTTTSSSASGRQADTATATTSTPARLSNESITRVAEAVFRQVDTLVEERLVPVNTRLDLILRRLNSNAGLRVCAQSISQMTQAVMDELAPHIEQLGANAQGTNGRLDELQSSMAENIADTQIIRDINFVQFQAMELQTRADIRRGLDATLAGRGMSVRPFVNFTSPPGPPRQTPGTQPPQVATRPAPIAHAASATTTSAIEPLPTAQPSLRITRSIFTAPSANLTSRASEQTPSQRLPLRSVTLPTSIIRGREEQRGPEAVRVGYGSSIDNATRRYQLEMDEMEYGRPPSASSPPRPPKNRKRNRASKGTSTVVPRPNVVKKNRRTYAEILMHDKWAHDKKRFFNDSSCSDDDDGVETDKTRMTDRDRRATSRAMTRERSLAPCNADNDGNSEGTTCADKNVQKKRGGTPAPVKVTKPVQARDKPDTESEDDNEKDEERSEDEPRARNDRAPSQHPNGNRK
ncbi:hypothetical protein PRIPAC_96208 [Pristionchus pacificus]|uniref:Uncharacterized protein n=1 Tax=Pristionchus pacificus TaxID=54126 RepID=A0A2A6B2R1_PRIPA|nr:hypothetical protein PRIPAC_96208 [Pristionchus pacificus]|eukprot:PDM60166.1 hypothetical protein PRIPAC_53991 [Pristionchus pacificus]